MASRKPSGRDSSPETTPVLPVSTPQLNGNIDPWTLQALVDLKSAVAKMDVTLGTLAEKVSDLRDEQEKTSTKLGFIEKQIYAATLIIGLAIAIGGFVANKAIDFGLDMAKTAANANSAAQAPSPAPVPPPAKK